MTPLLPKQSTLAILLILLFLLSACGFPPGAGAPTETPLPPTPAFTPTPIPPRALTICLGEEPNTLYPFGGANAAARSVLSAIYDGPIEAREYEYVPVILQKLPSLADGDALIEKITVTAGSEVVDADGNLISLAAGKRIRPSGCRSDDCAITYDGTSSLTMDQMVVNFSLRPDVKWSDGAPVTAQDSLYAFALASDSSTPVSKFVIDRTQTYEAADEQTVQWWGKPGFIDPTYFTNFWMPAPRHAWEQFSPADLPQVDVAARTPLGWGPYVLAEWIDGDHLRLTKNPYYFRSAQGLPRFDELFFRIAPDPNTALSALVAGQCDILDPGIHLDGQVGLLLEMEQAGQIQALFATEMTVEWLAFGVVPAAYDDGYNTSIQGDRQHLFADQRTRQAIAMCLDRQRIVDSVLYGLSLVPTSFVPQDHPLYTPAVTAYPYDVNAAIQLLDQVGWKDLDGDPSTPRRAQGVLNVAADTPLVLNYYTTGAAQRRQASEILSLSLAQCGVGLNLIYLSPAELYASGPQGVLFGRQFDLAQYAMGTTGQQPPCAWFMSTAIPNADNHWVGANVTGYRSAEYDAACREALQALPDETAYVEAYQRAQAIFTADLPSIPLYLRLNVAAARPDLCNFELDAGASNPLWNLEAFDYGAGCDQ